MGVVEIAAAALVLFASVTAVSGVAGAVMGSRREIGGMRGLIWGLLFPVLGLGRVLASGMLVRHDRSGDASREEYIRVMAAREAESRARLDRSAAREKGQRIPRQQKLRGAPRRGASNSREYERRIYGRRS